MITIAKLAAAALIVAGLAYALVWLYSCATIDDYSLSRWMWCFG